jgi:hypothetical protein
MPENLDVKIIRTYDSMELQIGGGGRETTVVQFTIGKHGPFMHTFDRNPDQFKIQQVIDERKRNLQPFV